VLFDVFGRLRMMEMGCLLVLEPALWVVEIGAQHLYAGDRDVSDEGDG
jgi:hypothetical protein